MKKCLRILALALVLLPLSLSAEIKLPFGKEEGSVSFLNANIDPNIEQLYPAGPKSFRFHGDEFWVADSLAGRLLRLDKAGKLLATLNLFKSGENEIVDFAVVANPKGELSHVLVLGGYPGEVWKVSPDGKEKTRLCKDFLQAEFIDVAPQGTFAVGDMGKPAIFLFAADGTPIRELLWNRSVFCFDPDGNLCYLTWDPTEKKHRLVSETPDGKQIRDIVLDLENSSPRLWSVSKDGEAVVSFTPTGGFDGKDGIALFDVAGKIKKQDMVPPPIEMNRFLAPNPAGGWFLGTGDFGLAPKESFGITDYSF